MLWSRLAACAACAACAAALVLVPAAGHTVTDKVKRGSSCDKPLRWHISLGDFGAPEGEIERGPVHVDLAYPNGAAHDFTVKASRPWRICKIHGTYKDRSAWSLPGTVGSTRRKSVAARSFPTSFKRSMRTFVINYARRRSPDGETCAAPRAVHYYGGGDAGARIKIVDERNRDRLVRYVARWRLGRASRLCYVKGWAFAGEPFTVRKGGDGSHPMDRYRSRGNHETPIAYLVIAFRR